MGIDYYSCDECGEAFPDVCGYAVCTDCGNRLCSKCMNEYGVSGEMSSAESLEEVEEEFKDEYDLCPFCSDDIITDDVLLAFAIEMLDTTKEKLIEEYLKDV